MVVLRTMSGPFSDVALFRELPTTPGRAHGQPYCLITADGDNDMPASAADAQVLRDPALLRWYSTNLVNVRNTTLGLTTVEVAKLRHIPILLDLHTSMRGGLLRTPLFATQRDKFVAMREIRERAAVPPAQRVVAAVLGHMSMTHPSRADALALVGRPGVVSVAKVRLELHFFIPVIFTVAFINCVPIIMLAIQNLPIHCICQL